MEGNVMSTQGGSKVEQVLQNGLNVDVSLYWVDFNGNEVLSGDLEPRATMQQVPSCTNPNAKP